VLRGIGEGEGERVFGWRSLESVVDAGTPPIEADGAGVLIGGVVSNGGHLKIPRSERVYRVSALLGQIRGTQEAFVVARPHLVSTVLISSTYFRSRSVRYVS